MKDEEKKKDKKPHPFYPDHVLNEVILIFCLFLGIIALVTFFPAPLEEKADPFITPEHIKPEWYFLATYQGLKVAEKLAFLGMWAPKVIGVLGQGLILILLLFWPWIEKRRLEKGQLIALGVLGFLIFIIFTLWGYYS